MKSPSRPRNLFWTPSSCSMSSSTRLSPSSLISAAGWVMRAISSLMAHPSSTTRRPQQTEPGLLRALALLQLDSLLGEVFDRPRVPGNRRGFLFLVLEPEVLRILVDADQFFLVLEDRLEDAIGGFLVHVLVRHQQVHHR